jgi:hypothetical protein
MCPNFGASQQRGKFLWIQTHQGEFGSGPGTGKLTEFRPIGASNRPLQCDSVLNDGQGRRPGGELLVLGLGRQVFMGFGVVDYLREQLVPERGQRPLP